MECAERKICPESAGREECCCGCCHEHTHGESGSVVEKHEIIKLSAAVFIAVAAYFLPLPLLLKTTLFACALGLSGGKVLLAALRNLGKGRIFDENFLMTTASIGAFFIGEMAEAVAVMIFYGVGEMLQEAAVARSRGNIEKLMDLRPDSARVLRSGKSVVIAPDSVAVGETILVLPGEKIPLDGVVVEGASFLDTRALTGESVPRRAENGAAVVSGCLALDGRLMIRVTKDFGESTVSKILELVRSAGSKKSKSERFITRFARVYTPTVVLLALAVAVVPPLTGFGTFSQWIYRALCFLIISCPCALVLSIPLSFFGGIGGAARAGVLVKGGIALELLEHPETVVFDKTGTLTEGVFKVVSCHCAPGVDSASLLRLAAAVEAGSRHPVARAILAAYGAPTDAVSDVREEAGHGVSAVGANGLVCAGNRRMMAKLGLTGLPEFPETVVYVAENGEYRGCILIADEPKPSAAAAIASLHRLGVRRLGMLTGDSPAIAEKIALSLNLDFFKGGLLPQEKVSELEALMEKKNGSVLYVGDGINDAPVLTRADLGIAMGGMGADAAIEAADVVIMDDDPRRLAVAVKVARRTRVIVTENIVLALGSKGAIMLLSLCGFASVWLAIFADVGVALLALANSLRVLRAGRKQV